VEISIFVVEEDELDVLTSNETNLKPQERDVDDINYS